VIVEGDAAYVKPKTSCKMLMPSHAKNVQQLRRTISRSSQASGVEEASWNPFIRRPCTLRSAATS
jgi:Ribonuclease G/E